MKRTIFGITILTMFILIISCNRKSEESKNSTEIFQLHENVISKNAGKYAGEINFFGKNSISVRLRKLTGSSYEEIEEKFNIQTPIVSSENIYKLTGCLKHNCPAYMVTILYDSKNDNLSVLLDENGKITAFNEKGEIRLTNLLKRK